MLVGHDWGAITANALGAHERSPYARIVAMSVPPLRTVDQRSPRLLARQARHSWYVGFNQLPLLPERTLPRLVRKLWRDWSPGYDAIRRPAARARRAGAPGAPVRGGGLLPRDPRTLAVPASYADWKRTWDGTPTVPTSTCTAPTTAASSRASPTASSTGSRRAVGP